MSVFIRRALVGAVLACASVSANAVDFGRTAGSFDVSSTGAATLLPGGFSGIRTAVGGVDVGGHLGAGVKSYIRGWRPSEVPEDVQKWYYQKLNECLRQATSSTR